MECSLCHICAYTHWWFLDCKETFLCMNRDEIWFCLWLFHQCNECLEEKCRWYCIDSHALFHFLLLEIVYGHFPWIIIDFLNKPWIAMYIYYLWIIHHFLILFLVNKDCLWCAENQICYKTKLIFNIVLKLCEFFLEVRNIQIHAFIKDV